MGQKKYRKTAAEFLARPADVTQSAIAGTRAWCDLHDMDYPEWARYKPTEEIPCRTNRNTAAHRHGRNAYTALLVMCDVRLAAAYNNDRMWEKAQHEAEFLCDIDLLAAIMGRNPRAPLMAERVCRQINPGYAAVMAEREAAKTA